MLLYCISALEALPILLISFLIKIINLNLKGFFPPNSFLYVKKIQSLMQPDSVLSKIPFFINIFDIICILATVFLSLAYDKICYGSTDRENHKNK